MSAIVVLTIAVGCAIPEGEKRTKPIVEYDPHDYSWNQPPPPIPSDPDDPEFSPTVPEDWDSSVNGEPLPFFKPRPIYPMRAKSAGIQGYIVLEFTVTTQGTTQDIVVVEESPKGIFSKAAMAAVKRYKYKPRIENGEAIEVHGVRTRLTFLLDQ